MFNADGAGEGRKHQHDQPPRPGCAGRENLQENDTSPACLPAITEVLRAQN